MEPVRRDMELLSNSMATYAHVRANPESLALFFMMGVCLGLFSALCLLIAGITCRRRLRRNHDKQAKPPAAAAPDLRRPSECSTEEASRDSAPRLCDGSARGVDVFTSEEELEKARRLERREKILREIWRNGQPDVLVTGTGTVGRVHYH